MTENLQEMSNLELIHKLRKDQGTMSFADMDKIFIIILERIIVRQVIDEKD
jgi:hypothetical protein